MRLRPGSEGISSIVRQLTLRRTRHVRQAYPAVSLAAQIRGWDVWRQNQLKRRFIGHICFIAGIPEELCDPVELGSDLGFDIGSSGPR